MTQEDVVVSRDLDPLSVAAFFVRSDQLQSEPDLTPMKLQKLLYIAQANYLASTCSRLFDARTEAFDHGPVVYDVWREFSGREIITPEKHPSLPTSPLPEDVESFLGRVWTKFGARSATWLRNYTHRQAPWQASFDPLSFRCVIPDQSMFTYFTQAVPTNERITHDASVVVTSSIFEDDELADERLAAFLRS